jgi:hypothetical protein
MTNSIRYNLATIRDLLLEAFDPDSLRQLFYFSDNPKLEPVHREFSPNDNLGIMAERIITYCRTRSLLPELLRAVQQANPDQYARFSDKLQPLEAGIGREPGVPPPEGYSGEVRRGLFALSEMMQDASVRKAVVAFGADFQAAREHARELIECKYLHDRLHELEFRCYTPISMEAGRFPEHDGVVETLSHYEFYLQEIADDLKEYVERPDCDMAEISWVKYVFQAQYSLRGATGNLDASLLKDALRQLRRVLTTQPTRINARLIAAAKSLRLSALVEAMEFLSTTLASLELEPERLSQFQTGVEALASLERSMSAMVADHDEWQRLDLDLRRIEAVMDLDTEELEASWADLKSLSGNLHRDRTEAWAIRFRESIDRLDEAIAAGNPKMIRQRFREYCREASERFYRVDSALKKQCEDLGKVGEPLAAVLEMLQ